MKIFLQEDLVEIGSAALRCGRWVLKHRDSKNKKIADIRNYYLGKWYAYLYTLKIAGITEFYTEDELKRNKGFLSKYRKGWMVCLWSWPAVIMRKKFFNQVLDSKQPHQGPTITKEIRKMFTEIK